MKLGDTIGIVACSFPLPREETNSYFLEYLRGIEEIKSMGFKVKESKNLRKIKFWYAGTPQERASDINDMFADPEVKAIMVHDGGQSAIAVLEYLDFENIKANPKPFIGFSDITFIQNAIWQMTGVPSLNGPLITYNLGECWNRFGENSKKEGIDLFKKVLLSESPLGVIKPWSKWECWREGISKGNLFGGTLGNITHLCGTKYFPDKDKLKDAILFWEFDGPQSYKIEKCLYQLKYAGVFELISGMIIGKFVNVKRTAWEGFEEPTNREIVMSVVGEFGFPILAEVDFGHEMIAIPIPIGKFARMDSKELLIQLL